MRILDDLSDKKIDRITLYLKMEEAIDLRDSLQDLISNRDHHHSHVSSEDFQKEITVCLYEIDNLSGFDERSKTLIIYDK